MKGLDLRTPTITNIKVNINHLNGLIINYQQAIALSLHLGVIIKA